MLRFYQDKIRVDEEDLLYEIMADALADMMHLANFEKINWSKVAKAARSYYDAEVRDQAEGPRSWSPRGWRYMK